MKTEITEKEMAALNLFCAEKVMGWKRVPSVMEIGPSQFYVHAKGDIYIHHHGNHVRVFNPATNSADSREVEKKCAEKMAALYDDDSTLAVQFVLVQEIWRVQQTDFANGYRVEAPTLELAIARFAEKLFSK